MSQTKAQLISDLVQALAFTATASAPTNGMFLSATNELAISTNSTQRLTVDSSGQVGIGTTTVNNLNKLHLQAASASLPSTSNQSVLLVENSNNTWVTIGSSASNYSGILFADPDDADVGQVRYNHNGNSLEFLTNAQERLRIDSSGSVGIGTSSPSVKLEVSGTSNVTSRAIFARTDVSRSAIIGGNRDTSNCPFVGTPDNEAFALITNNTEQMRIDSSGRLLVGTSSNRSSSALQVEGTTFDTSRLSLTQNSATASAGATLKLSKSKGTSNGSFTAVSSGDRLGNVLFSGADGSGDITAATIEAFVDGTPGSNDMPGRLVFSTTADGSASPTERMRINSSGNVGIGTTSPAFTEGSGLRIERAATATLRLQDTGAHGFEISASSSNAKFRSMNNKPFVFANSTDSELMSIDSSGNVGIGTSSPDALLTVSGTTNIHAHNSSGDASIALSTGGTPASPTKKYTLFVDDSDGDKFIINDSTAGQRRLVIDSSGNVGIGTTSPGAALDVVSTTEPQGVFANSDSNGANIRFQNSTTGSGQTNGLFVGIDASEKAVIYNYENTDLLFGTNSTERVRIDSSGRVGIGITSLTRNLTVQDSSTIVTAALVSNPSNISYLLFGDTDSDAQGRVQYDNSSDSLQLYSNGSERLRIDSSGRLLVGTSFEGEASADNLTINDSGNCGMTIRSGTNNFGGIYFSDATSGGGEYDGYIAYNQPNRYMSFATGQAERMRLDISGRLMLGTTSVRSFNTHASRFQVQGTDFSSSTVSIVNNANDTTGAYLFFAKQRSGAAGGNTIVQSGDLLGQLRFNACDGVDMETVAASVDVRVDGTPGANDMPARIEFRVTQDGSNGTTERMRLDNNGRLGIGTASAAQVLQVHKAASSASYIHITNSVSGSASSDGMLVGLNASAAALVWNQENTEMRFATNNAERMRIDNSGRVFIGSTGFTSNNTVRVNMSFTGGGTEYGMCMNAGSLVAGTKYITFDISTTNYGSIGWNGSAIQYYTSSDYRLKENIVSLEGGIDRVKQLQPRRFNYTHNSDMTVDGFIAHEAQVAVPEAVSGTHDEIDDNGNPVYQNIDLSKFVPLLTAALKEAVAKIETLEAKVAALEAG